MREKECRGNGFRCRFSGRLAYPDWVPPIRPAGFPLFSSLLFSVLLIFSVFLYFLFFV